LYCRGGPRADQHSLPTIAPISTIGFGNRRERVFRFRESITSTGKAKLVGSIGVEISSTVGTTPATGLADLRFVTGMLVRELSWAAVLGSFGQTVSGLTLPAHVQ